MLLRYTLRRLILTLPLLLGITFGMLQLTPGNPVQAEAAFNPDMSPESIRALRELYGLNDPIPVQYWNWLKRLASFDFGHSFSDQQPVLTKVAKALPATLLLNLCALTLTLAIGIPLGLFSALREGSRLERALTQFTFGAWAVPFFWLALICQLAFGVWMGIFPVSGFRSIRFSEVAWWKDALDILWHLTLPLLVTTFGSWAYLSRQMRNSTLEVLGQDYIRTARAKGLDEATVLKRHALPNALLPIVTILGLSIPGLIGGSFITETIFAWPGMGLLGWEAAVGYDYPVVMGVVMMGAFLTVLGNLVADVSYALLDPRIKY